MCGRYTLIIDGERIAQATGWTIRSQVYPRYNIAPTETVLASRRAPGGEAEIVAPPDGSVLTFAGLWERWVSPDGEPIQTCAIITVAGNATLHGIHERMPAIIDPGDRDAWLDVGGVSAGAAHGLLRSAPNDLLQGGPVSTAVN